MTDAGQQVGSASWGAVVQSAQSRGYGTSDADLEAYGAAAGAAGAAAACAAYGLAAAATLCAAVGSAVGAAVTHAILSLGHALFGSSSQPDAGDVFNPAADRIVASLVLLSLGKPHDAAAVHALGEAGIRSLAGRQADGSATDPRWLEIAGGWAMLANAFARTHTRRASAAPEWFYAAGPKAGRVRGAVVASYGNGPDDRADISAAMTAAAAASAAEISAGTRSASGGSGAIVAGLLGFLWWIW